MTDVLPEPISRESFDSPKLVGDFPPRLRERNKKVVYRLACPPGSTHQGRVVFTRWGEMPVPERFPAAHTDTSFEAREDVFSYEPTPLGSQVIEWYLNFAHHDLFCAYGGSLLAQDELQVAEHPVLASLREALLQSSTVQPATVEHGRPTPILIRGAERRCAIATDRNDAEGRPFGLYGNNFAQAKPDVVERATRVIQPPTITNLIAIEAPAYGSEVYSQAEIDYIVATAYTGFRAAVIESRHAAAENLTSFTPVVVIHTGFWGCGAYGGNRIMMAMLQLLAARLAGIDRLVFHTFDKAGLDDYSIATATLERIRDSQGGAVEVRMLLKSIEALGLCWGASDGT